MLNTVFRTSESPTLEAKLAVNAKVGRPRLTELPDKCKRAVLLS